MPRHRSSSARLSRGLQTVSDGNPLLLKADGNLSQPFLLKADGNPSQGRGVVGSCQSPVFLLPSPRVL